MPDELQQPIYTPTDILNIVKEHLTVANTLVVVEGIYIQCGTKDYRGVWYDAVKSQYDNYRLTAIIPTAIRSLITAGDVVQFCGTMEKSLNENGQVSLQLRVSNLVGKKEKEVDAVEKAVIEIQQRKSSMGYKNVDSVLESILYAGEQKPQVALLFAEASITDHDFQAGVQAAKDAIDFSMAGISFARTTDFIRKLQQLDSSACDVLCIVRGGGSGLEVFDNPELAEVVMNLKTPTLSAIGHQVDNPLVCKITDKNIGTPSLLGQYFKDMVERITAEKSNSKAVLVKQVEEQFKKQVETLQTQNKNLQEQFTKQSEQSKMLIERMDKVDEEKKRLYGQIKGLESNLKSAKIKNVILWIGLLVLAGLFLYLRTK